ncbi:MAG: Xaa-Pro aminopeptidase 1 [Myxococcales bacterium]
MEQFATRRARFMERMGSGIAVIPAASLTVRNSDVDHEFRQDSAFYYLTGFEEPDAVLVLRPGHSAPFTLFVPPRDKEKETWTGRRAGPEGAKDHYGADAAFPLDALDAELAKLMEGADRLVYAVGSPLDRRVLKAMRHHRTMPRSGAIGPDLIVEPASILDELRLRKSPDEIAALRQAADITSLGHREAMRVAAPGLWEYQVQAVMELSFRAHGSPRNGYPSIVAGGPNATILHYNTNRMLLRGGDLLLIDAGAEHGYLTADITRTFPVSGRFSGPQRDVYEVVLGAQKASIATCVAGGSFQASHDRALEVLVEGMVALGLLAGDTKELIAAEAYKPYYMHRTSHWLGMDVHDAGVYRRGTEWRTLEPGMVLTVEPGLYIAEDAPVDERLRGIGVRIEDDVLITEAGPVVLTAMCPKELDDVERVCAEPSRFAPFLPLVA